MTGVPIAPLEATASQHSRAHGASAMQGSYRARSRHGCLGQAVGPPVGARPPTEGCRVLTAAWPSRRFRQELPCRLTHGAG